MSVVRVPSIARSNRDMSHTSTIETSSTITTSSSSGADSSCANANSSSPSLSSSTRDGLSAWWIVCAGRLITSFIRCAALPVGAHRRICVRPHCSSARTIVSIVNVLPTPAPPLITTRRRDSAADTASACRSFRDGCSTLASSTLISSPLGVAPISAKRRATSCSASSVAGANRRPSRFAISPSAIMRVSADCTTLKSTAPPSMSSIVCADCSRIVAAVHVWPSLAASSMIDRIPWRIRSGWSIATPAPIAILSTVLKPNPGTRPISQYGFSRTIETTFVPWAMISRLARPGFTPYFASSTIARFSLSRSVHSAASASITATGIRHSVAMRRGSVLITCSNVSPNFDAMLAARDAPMPLAAGESRSQSRRPSASRAMSSSDSSTFSCGPYFACVPILPRKITRSPCLTQHGPENFTSRPLSESTSTPAEKSAPEKNTRVTRPLIVSIIRPRIHRGLARAILPKNVWMLKIAFPRFHGKAEIKTD